jgi:hypothetical protein
VVAADVRRRNSSKTGAVSPPPHVGGYFLNGLLSPAADRELKT